MPQLFRRLFLCFIIQEDIPAPVCDDCYRPSPRSKKQLEAMNKNNKFYPSQHMSLAVKGINVSARHKTLFFLICEQEYF